MHKSREFKGREKNTRNYTGSVKNELVLSLRFDLESIH